MPRDLNTKLAPIPRCRQSCVRDMRFQIEVLVLHPIGEIEIERQAVELALEHW